MRFYSRLPVPALPWEQDAHALPNFPRLVRVIPLAGLLLGLVPAAAMIVALALDLGPWLSAMLAVAAMVLATGALHEDGLADVADSFGATTRDRRLEIMRDSRIGSFGAAALFLALALRIGALAEIVSRADAARRRRGNPDHRLPVPHGRPDAPGLPPAGPARTACPMRSGSRRGTRSGSRPGSRAPSPSSLERSPACRPSASP